MPERKPKFYLSALTLIAVSVLITLLATSFRKLDYSWDFSSLIPYIWEGQTHQPGVILQGLIGTFRISLVSIVLGSAVGALIGLMLLSREPILRWAALAYVDLFRNTPLLVQLYLAYFVVGAAFQISAEHAGIGTLSLFYAAYIADLLRGTIQSFERGQLDAGKSLGLSSLQVAVWVVSPQAIRRMLPALVGFFVSLVKDSSLVSVLGILDLTKAALNVVSVTFRAFETWFVIALCYLALNLLLSSSGRWLERRLSAETA